MERTSIENKRVMPILKTYILQFIYPKGNGWAFINATSVTQAESIFYTQTRYEGTKVTSIQETKWFGDNMQLVYEGAVTTCTNLNVSISLSDLIKNSDAYSSVEEYLNSIFNFDNYYNKSEVNDAIENKVEELLKDIELPELNLDNYITKQEASSYIQEEISKMELPKDGKDGKDGEDGKDGTNGINGKDGVGITDVRYEGNSESGNPNKLTVFLSNGTKKGPFLVYNGKDGESSVAPTPSVSFEGVVEVTQFGIGSFSDAWNKAKSEPENMFQWWLSDVDAFGNPVNKIIWHIGNKQFRDALGSTIVGRLDGLTVTCNKPCVMHILSNEPTSYKHVLINLTTGINNFTFEELNTIFTEAGCSGSPQNVSSINFFKEGTTVVNAVYDHDSVVAIDFGGITVTSTNTSSAYKKEYFLANQVALKTIDRLVLTSGISVCNGCTNLVSANLSGNIRGNISLFNGCSKLSRVDMTNLNISNVTELLMLKADYNTNGSTTDANKTLSYGRMKELDLSSLDTSSMTKINAFLTGCGNLEKLTIGNFTTESVTSASYCLIGVSDSILVCTTTTPPALGYDWIKDHFRRIYVPDSAVNAYKAAWSNYATIICSISDYNE